MSEVSADSNPNVHGEIGRGDGWYGAGDYAVTNPDDPVTNTLMQVSRRLSRPSTQGTQVIVSSPPSSQTASCLNSVLNCSKESLSSSLYSEDSIGKQSGGRMCLPPMGSNSSVLPPLNRNLSCLSLRTSCRDGRLERGSVTLPGSLSELKVDSDGLVTPPICSQTSVLKQITSKEARSRSFLVGRVSSGGSLLGTEELQRYFPNRVLRIFVGTWNMNGQNPPNSLNDFLLPERITYLPDMYVIGTQEGLTDKKEWEIRVQTCLGPSHVLFHSVALGVLHLVVFLRRDLIWFCSVAEEDSFSTRPGTMVKTKGGAAISFVFFGVSFLFINSHFTAHDRKIKERVSDYERLCNMISLPKLVPLKSHYKGKGSKRLKDVTERFDYVFWFGDLNFRLDQERSKVIRTVSEALGRERERQPRRSASFEELLKHDQLKKLMDKGLAFQGFQEASIYFGPSYKFSSGSFEFDAVKQRVPSYTDRVLYRSRVNGSVQCNVYTMVPEIQTSDHRPVYALFEVTLRPGQDNIPLAAGLFNREVYIEGNKRRAAEVEKEVKYKGSVVCSLM